MPNLVIDIGNTFVKISVFEANKLVYNQKTNELTTEFIIKLIEKHQTKNLIVSSVKKELGFNEDEIKKKVNYILFNGETLIPIKNKYETPKSLGLDRLAGVIGANFLYPNQNILVIDAGTCITYDTLNNNAEYFGGSISPGLNMRFNAMHHFTSKLPLVNFEGSFKKSFGGNTEDAMSSGVINGTFYEAEGFIKQYLIAKPDAKIILCGGDSAFFDSKFKNSIFAHLILHEPNLVLIGLNTVVNYQHDLK
ncbi:type III pantothenate kinase [Pedobacter alpinus]|uniref:Type III pantothenate kinase n=1 Tax=Pedobacter alpinus TaxID=1590643 RepID=A0ABW5TQ49_9SPHI